MVPSSRARHFAGRSVLGELGDDLAVHRQRGFVLRLVHVAQDQPPSNFGSDEHLARKAVRLLGHEVLRAQFCLAAHEVLLVVRHIDERQSLRTPTVGDEVPRAFVVVVDRRGRESPALGRFGILAAARELLWCLGLESVVALQHLREDRSRLSLGALAVGCREFLFHLLQRGRVETCTAAAAFVVGINRFPISACNSCVYIALHGVTARAGG